MVHQKKFLKFNFLKFRKILSPPWTGFLAFPASHVPHTRALCRCYLGYGKNPQSPRSHASRWRRGACDVLPCKSQAIGPWGMMFDAILLNVVVPIAPSPEDTWCDGWRSLLFGHPVDGFYGSGHDMQIWRIKVILKRQKTNRLRTSTV